MRMIRCCVSEKPSRLKGGLSEEGNLAITKHMRTVTPDEEIRSDVRKRLLAKGRNWPIADLPPHGAIASEPRMLIKVFAFRCPWSSKLLFSTPKTVTGDRGGPEATHNGQPAKRHVPGSSMGTTVIHSFESLARSSAQGCSRQQRDFGESQLKDRTRAPSLRDALFACRPAEKPRGTAFAQAARCKPGSSSSRRQQERSHGRYESG
ncbi:hypothetical protein AWB75_06692 [Caballeronia catudaia]|uniref:Uncharacterized protein n=1 Tax=Caballeronia catudaia TaxID=1777136 RepID=A0A158DG18_9BURK|nr:hypothetical protein AWB75_06692 [Caballeronia catudaia]